MKKLNLIALILLTSFFTGRADEQIKLQFSPGPTNNNAREVINFYQHLTGKKVVYDSEAQGPVPLFIEAPVSHEKAIEIIERTLFADGYALVDVASDTIQVVSPAHNPRTIGIPTYSKPDEIPQGERVFSYIIKLQHRGAEEIQKLLQFQVAPTLCTNIVSDPKSQTVIVTERTSVIRGLLKAVAAYDVPPTDKK
jgi:type II secretory pathway component GspD/PulD (secretin)